jgi:hypothetical protein
MAVEEVRERVEGQLRTGNADGGKIGEPFAQFFQPSETTPPVAGQLYRFFVLSRSVVIQRAQRKAKRNG